tara:strand:+ start:1157 stop:2095 length:939 start_codon:yes stop_codon:yes gene_type:complete
LKIKLAKNFVIYLFLLSPIFHWSILKGHAATMYLVSGVTEGSSQVPGDKAVPLAKGRFLPPAAHITSSSEGGFELLGGGWTLRLGKNISFSALDGGIKLSNGAILAKPMRKSAELILSTDLHSFQLYGKGAFLAETISDGGLRVIALTGDICVTVTSKKRRKQMKLDPGQRIECNSEGKFGRIVDLDLAQLIQTSRLLRLFGNPPSFTRALANVANKQSKRMVGESARVDLFLGVSYLPANEHFRTKDTAVGKIEPIVKSPDNATGSSTPAPSRNDSLQVEELPVVPGPPIRFPTSTAPPSSKSFPGRIFDR